MTTKTIKVVTGFPQPITSIPFWQNQWWMCVVWCPYEFMHLWTVWYLWVHLCICVCIVLYVVHASCLLTLKAAVEWKIWRIPNHSDVGSWLWVCAICLRLFSDFLALSRERMSKDNHESLFLFLWLSPNWRYKFSELTCRKQSSSCDKRKV